MYASCTPDPFQSGLTPPIQTETVICKHGICPFSGDMHSHMVLNEYLEFYPRTPTLNHTFTCVDTSRQTGRSNAHTSTFKVQDLRGPYSIDAGLASSYLVEENPSCYFHISQDANPQLVKKILCRGVFVV